jgi:NO-binding membrane sensor protein with MHYT domain
MPATYNSWLVALSVVVAIAVAYTALKLADRVGVSRDEASRTHSKLAAYR